MRLILSALVLSPHFKTNAQYNQRKEPECLVTTDLFLSFCKNLIETRILLIKADLTLINPVVMFTFIRNANLEL